MDSCVHSLTVLHVCVCVCVCGVCVVCVCVCVCVCGVCVCVWCVCVYSYLWIHDVHSLIMGFTQIHVIDSINAVSSMLVM